MIAWSSGYSFCRGAEQLHRFRRQVGFQHAIGQQQRRLHLQGLLFVEHFQLLHSFRQPAELVVRQRQIHPYARIVRQLLERDGVLRNGIGELPVLHQGGA